MAKQAQVAVVGLRALNRDIAKLVDDRGPLYKALAHAGQVAAEPVAAATRSSLPEVTGRLAGDVRVTASKSGASVRMGRSSLRYAGWVEFGGHRRVPRPSTREYRSLGRYMFPHAVQLASTSARLYTDAVTAALGSYHWTNTGDSPHD